MCSPLDRTRETAAAIARARAALPVASRWTALIEIDMGEWTGRELADFGDDPAWRAWNDRARHRAHPRRRDDGGGAGADRRAARPRWRAASDGRTVAVVSHADMIGAAVAHVLGLPLDNLLRFDVSPRVGDPGGVGRLGRAADEPERATCVRRQTARA